MPRAQVERHRLGRPVVAVALSLACLIGTPKSAEAQRETELRWEYPTFGTAEIVLSTVMVGGLVTTLIIGPNPNTWTGQNSFDEGARDKLRVRNTHGQQIIRDTSDVTLALTLTYPFLVDALLMSAWFRQSPKTAVQISLITAEAVLVTSAIATTVKNIAARERPYVRECGGELPAEIGDCQGNRPNRSFFSGHAATSFTAAAATCMHHANLPIHGEGPKNMIPCAGTLLFAASTALFRVMADQHYATDVIAGAAVGAGVGVFIPWLFHYRHKGDRKRASKRIFLVLPQGAGAQITGAF